MTKRKPKLRMSPENQKKLREAQRRKFHEAEARRVGSKQGARKR